MQGAIPKFAGGVDCSALAQGPEAIHTASLMSSLEICFNLLTSLED